MIIFLSRRIIFKLTFEKSFDEYLNFENMMAKIFFRQYVLIICIFVSILYIGDICRCVDSL